MSGHGGQFYETRILRAVQLGTPSRKINTSPLPSDKLHIHEKGGEKKETEFVAAKEGVFHLVKIK